MNKKIIYRPNTFKKKIIPRNKRSLFLRGDEVIVISGKYKKTVGKIVKQIKPMYYIIDTIFHKPGDRSSVEKRLKIKIVMPNIHVSNISHYDSENKTHSKVKLSYIFVNEEGRERKLRKIIYKKTGRTKIIRPILVKEEKQDNEKA